MPWASVLKSLLTVCVFTSFAVSTVESYSCANFTCFNGNCDSKTQTCEASQGCFSRVQELKTLVSSSSSVIQEKSCSTNGCTQLAFSASLGSQVKFGYEQRCCQAEQCNKEDIQLSQQSSEANGVECPACYNETYMSCDPVPLKCTGAQTKCVEVIGTVPTVFGSQLAVYGKGCATESACNLHTDVFGGINIRTFCSSGSPPLPSVSSVLIGVLLLKVFL